MKKIILRAVPRLKKRVSLVYSYKGKVIDEPNLPTGLKWDVATIELIGQLMGNDEKRGVRLKKLIRQGAKGVIIHDGESWAAHGFFSPPGVALPEHLPVKIVKNYWWLFNMHTRIGCRGQGLQKCCNRIRFQLINELNGSGHIMTDTGLYNIPARKGFISTGFSPKGFIYTIRLKLPKIGSKLIFWRWVRNGEHPKI